MMSEWEDFGLVLSSSGGYGVHPRLFDTSNVGNEIYGDADLGTPNERCSPPGPGRGEGGEPGMKGENCEFLGNVLIIQENNFDSSIPDDNVNGGIILFDFENVAEYVYDIGLLDVNYNASITVIYQATNGNMKRKKITVPILGDNSYQALPINTANVRQILLTMVRSAAVTSISFCSPSMVAPITPTPAPIPPMPSRVTPTTPTTAPVIATLVPVTPVPGPVTPTPATVTPLPSLVIASDREGEEQCKDILGWYDSDGPMYDCHFYAHGRNCQRFDSEYENFGYAAKEACCACGGGNIVVGDRGGGDGGDGGISNSGGK